MNEFEPIPGLGSADELDIAVMAVVDTSLERIARGETVAEIAHDEQIRSVLDYLVEADLPLGQSDIPEHLRDVAKQAALDWQEQLKFMDDDERTALATSTLQHLVDMKLMERLIEGE